MLIDEAFEFHINENCVDAALGEGAHEWLGDQVAAAQIGVDEDVFEMEEWDYARGYWVEESLRYQYWGYPIWLAEQIITESDLRQIAITLVHETAHEFGYTSDEGIAEALGHLCTTN